MPPTLLENVNRFLMKPPSSSRTIPTAKNPSPPISYNLGRPHLKLFTLFLLASRNYDKALKRFEEALKIDREIGNRQGEANQLGNIGRVYLRKDELDEALKYLEEALDILNRFNLVYGRDIIEEAIREIKRRKGESQ